MPPDEPICLDLRLDLEPIRSFLKNTSDRLASRNPDRLIIGIHIAFYHPGGYLEVSFFDDPEFDFFNAYKDFVLSEKYHVQHWSILYDICCRLPTRTTSLEGEIISTKVSRSSNYPQDWSKVVEWMGEVIVRAVATPEGTVFDSLAGSEKLKIGVFTYCDDEFYWVLTRTDGKMVIERG